MTAHELLALANQLPPDERHWLLTELQAAESADGPRAATGFGALLSIAGTAHSAHTDVSTSKMHHLGEIYADRQ